MDKAIEKIGRALQRKFNWNIAIYLRHPERDEYFNEMASEALYQAEKLGYRKLPKDKPPLLSDKRIKEALGYRADEELSVEDKSLSISVAKAQGEADIKHYEQK